jgi:hypothetical protein
LKGHLSPLMDDVIPSLFYGPIALPFSKGTKISAGPTVYQKLRRSYKRNTRSLHRACIEFPLACEAAINKKGPSERNFFYFYLHNLAGSGKNGRRRLEHNRKSHTTERIFCAIGGRQPALHACRACVVDA